MPSQDASEPRFDRRVRLLGLPEEPATRGVTIEGYDGFPKEFVGVQWDDDTYGLMRLDLLELLPEGNPCEDKNFSLEGPEPEDESYPWLPMLPPDAHPSNRFIDKHEDDPYD